MSDMWDEIQIEIDRSAPSSLAAHLDRDRSYDGQPHTDHGERGRTLVTGLTMRDVIDCYVRACYDSSGLSPGDWPSDLYGLPWDDMDPVAVGQNLTCWVERYMGIYPNVRKVVES